MKPRSPAPLCFAHEILHFAQFAGFDDVADAIGVDRAVLEDPEATLPITCYYDALELAAARSGKQNFGLHFALHWVKVAQDGLASMHFLIRSSPNLRVACDRILRYQRFWNPGEWYDAAQDRDTYSARYRPWGPPRPAHVHQAEKTAALMALVPRGVDPGSRPISVKFPHASYGDEELVRRIFGVQPSYGAAWTEVTLPAAVMDRPLPTANPALFGFLDRYMAKQMAQLPTDASYAARAMSTVQRLLHEPGFGQERVARELGCGARTLARRLAGEGTNIRAIVETVRKARAEDLLDGSRSVGEVAFLLGYSEPAAFLHAFRRWHGTNPRAWIERRLPPPARAAATNGERPAA
jgi:AraC-like DNA-binding protein